MQCKCDVFGSGKFGSVVAAVATQGCVGSTVVLFVVLWMSHHGPCRTGVQVPGHSIANDFSLHTILLCDEGECNQGGIVRFHSACSLMCHCVGPLVECHVLQAEGGVFGTE